MAGTYCLVVENKGVEGGGMYVEGGRDRGTDTHARDRDDSYRRLIIERDIVRGGGYRTVSIGWRMMCSCGSGGAWG